MTLGRRLFHVFCYARLLWAFGVLRFWQRPSWKEKAEPTPPPGVRSPFVRFWGRVIARQVQGWEYGHLRPRKVQRKIQSKGSTRMKPPISG
jgi:hypothetical protein